jgi:hypothetical protein
MSKKPEPQSADDIAVLVASSKYPVLYCSSSGEWMRIDDRDKMHDFRLVAVYNKLKDTDSQSLADAAETLLYCLKQEMDDRGLDPRYKGGRPPLDEPLGDSLEEGFA